MNLTVAYNEIETKVKELAKVSLLIRKYDEKSLKVVYASGIPFMPDIDVVLTIVNVYSDKLELTYSCSPLVGKAVEKLLPKAIERFPKGVVNINGKNIMLNLAEIDKLEKVLKFLSLEKIEVNDDNIEVFVAVR
ncbi:MAG: hypothetical protein IKY22_02160 [Bacteroidales bacterium]|nr:hypothetical protein [Bacteroidales bacterium]